MNTNLRHIALLALAVAGSLIARPVQADHDHYEHLDALAHQAQALTRELSREARLHLAGTHQYRAIQSDISTLLQLEARIVSGAHAFGSPRHLHRDVERMHDAIHHLEEHLGEIQNHGHDHGHFHSHRVDVRHLIRIVGRLDKLCSQMDDEVHRIDDHGFYSGPSPVSRPGIAVRPGGVSLGGFSIQFGR